MSRIAQPFFYGVTLMIGAAVMTACSTPSTGAAATPGPVSTGTPIHTREVSAPLGSQPAKTTGRATLAPAKTAGRATLAPAKTVTSNVSALKALGIDLNVGVLIDVADDGRDRFLQISKGGVVDFTGTTKTDDTMMALKPAQVGRRTEKTKNRVVIAPPFYNEDLGPGACVADTAPGVLRLATCKAGDADQTWQVVPGGDSGQFELHGAHTDIRVNNGRITTGNRGNVGLQTIKFAE